MKKSCKKVFSIIMLATMFSTTFSNTYAKDNDSESNTVIFRMSEEEIEKATLDEIQKELDNITANKPTTRGYDDEMVLLKKIGQKDTWTKYGDALGQPSKGTIFATKGSGFYWSDSKKTSDSISLSVSIGGNMVSMSIGFQPGTITQSSGKFISIRANQVNKRVKLQVKREYRVTRYAVYTYKKYQGPSKAKFYKYQNAAVPVAKGFDVKNI